jgi:histidine phosphotransfer protein HptB
MMTNIQHLDKEALALLKDVMEDDFALLVETFIQDSRTRIATLRNVLNTSGHAADADTVRRAAHSFKGSCSNLGALHLANLCGALESQSLTQDVTKLAETIAEIESEFATVNTLLQKFL